MSSQWKGGWNERQGKIRIGHHGGRVDEMRGRGQPREAMLISLTSRHVLGTIGHTQDRRPWMGMTTNKTWHGL